MNARLLSQIGGALAIALGLKSSGNGAGAKAKRQFLDLETKSTDDAFAGLHFCKGIWDILDGSLDRRSQPLFCFRMASSA